MRLLALLKVQVRFCTLAYLSIARAHLEFRLEYLLLALDVARVDAGFLEVFNEADSLAPTLQIAIAVRDSRSISFLCITPIRKIRRTLMRSRF